MENRLFLHLASSAPEAERRLHLAGRDRQRPLPGGNRFGIGGEREPACEPLFRSSLMLLAFNQPCGVLSQFTADVPGQKMLAEFGFPARVYPLGRLDLDSEG